MLALLSVTREILQTSSHHTRLRNRRARVRRKNVINLFYTPHDRALTQCFSDEHAVAYRRKSGQDSRPMSRRQPRGSQPDTDYYNDDNLGQSSNGVAMSMQSPSYNDSQAEHERQDDVSDHYYV